MGKCIYCNKNISWLDYDKRCFNRNHDHIAHLKCCMRENTVVLTQQQQEQCKHEYVNLADKQTFSWTLLKTTYKCKKCGHEIQKGDLI